MERQAAIQEIRQRISCKDYLTKSKNGMYCCPFCESGTGPNKTGALKLYSTNTWTCHSCRKSGDVIDLYRNQTGVDFNTAISDLAQEIGITIDRYNLDNPKPNSTGQREPEQMETATDFMTYYKECRPRLADPAAIAYLEQRGISVDTAAAYWIGFDPAADPANAPGGTGEKQHPCPRLIIPTNKTHYIGRRIDGVKDFAKINPKGSTPGIFNEAALLEQGAQEVFVTEGAFDALSVMEAGATAIALNSTANADALIKRLEQQRTNATLILCLDNDDAGKKATETIRAGLQRLNIGCITANISGDYKDPNEHLTGNRAAFLDAVEQARRQASAKPDNTAYYIDTLMGEEVERFKDDKKTGFTNLDKEAGGLYAGLYALAAISSLGKTSFALQLADQLAERGQDVIYFSLEQSRLELVSKSIARRTAQKDMGQAVTSLSIRKGYLPRQVLEAAQEYKEAVADRVSIVEGNFNCNISFIGDYVRQYVRRTNTRPVVFIDYLQILQPADDTRRQTTKETIDNTVTTLKRLSRELDLTIIVISSVNRANYLTPIDFESLKESGSIEFTCDVVWGLQLQCLNDPAFEKAQITKQRETVKQAKAANPRKIELVCLKNRYGIANYSCCFDYYPANDLFLEQAAAGFAATETKWANARRV